MNAKTKTLWAEVKAKSERGEWPAVFVTRAGTLALDGSAAELPAEIAALYPEEIRAAARAKAAERDKAEAERQAAENTAAEKTQRARQAIIEQYRKQRVWRLAGLYVDDQSTARYTYDEIAAWLDWDACNLTHNNAAVYAVCERGGVAGDWFLDLSNYFAPIDSTRGRTPSCETLATRLREFVSERNVRMADRN